MTFKLKTLKELKGHFNSTKEQVLTYESISSFSFDKLEEPKMRSSMKLLEAVLLKIEEQINILAKDRDVKITRIDEKLKVEIEKTKQQDGEKSKYTPTKLKEEAEKTKQQDSEKPKYTPTKLKEEAEKAKQRAEGEFNEKVQCHIMAYYGAMLIAQQDISAIGRNRSKKLVSALAEAIGIDKFTPVENQPNANDYEAFYVSFNVVMHTHLFPSTGARKGFKEEHMLSALPKDDLERILTKAYEFEKNARMAVVGGLVAEGKSVIKLTGYTVTAEMETPDSATERFKSFAELKKNLNSIIIEELNDKKKGTINEVESRATQLNFLKKLGDLLEDLTIKDTEKTAILAGSMYLVRRQIQKSYEDSIIHFIRSPDNSKVHEALGGLLDAANISSFDHEALLQAANNFIRYVTLERKNPEQKTINRAHPFTEIEGFNLHEVLNLFFELICSSRDSACKQMFIAMKESEKVEQPASSSTSYWSSLIGSYAKVGLFGGGKKAESPDTAHTDSLPLDAPSTSLQ
ncbi:MAG: hypothetical protein LEGION0403_FIIPPAGN_01557 [Legionella sp.]|uniref:hypothetical protein n=1 Tax=Legionella sp. TaxID=459 RepID=UPI003D1487F0